MHKQIEISVEYNFTIELEYNSEEDFENNFNQLKDKINKNTENFIYTNYNKILNILKKVKY